MARSLVSNPPYNMPWNPPPPLEASMMSSYQRTEVPPKNNANFAFILSALDQFDRRAAFLLPNTVLDPATKEEKAILCWMLESNLIAGVVLLPDRMFESTAIAVCVLILEKKRQTRRVAFVDLRKSATTEIREQRGQFGGNSHTERVYKKAVNVLSSEVIAKAVDAVLNMKEEQRFSVVVDFETIAANDGSLAPARYLAQEIPVVASRSFEDIAADYNRIVAMKNSIRITMNETIARRLYPELLKEKPDLSETFAVVGQKCEKEDYFTTSKSDGIVIRCGTKCGAPILITDFLRSWTQFLRFLNDEENRILAEFRDAILPELMSGKIKIK